MKTAVLVTLVFLFNSAQALACSPPPHVGYIQAHELSAITSSVDVIERLTSLGGDDIESIQTTAAGYIVRSTNGTWVRAKVKYEGDVGGRCPSIVGIEFTGSGKN